MYLTFYLKLQSLSQTVHLFTLNFLITVQKACIKAAENSVTKINCYTNIVSRKSITIKVTALFNKTARYSINTEYTASIFIS